MSSLIVNNQKDKTIRHWWLYAIALEQGKYYVGITSHQDPMDRLRQHGGSYGASWTKKYKPLKPIQPLVLRDLGHITQTAAERQEQDLFEEYAKLHGLRNVRGGQITWTSRVYRIGKFYFTQEALWGAYLISVLFALMLYIIFGKQH